MEYFVNFKGIIEGIIDGKPERPIGSRLRRDFGPENE